MTTYSNDGVEKGNAPGGEDCTQVYNADGTPKADLSGNQAEGSRRFSMENPPVTPHAYDDEFNSTTLDAKWTTAPAGFDAGTVDPLATLAGDAVYDLTTWPSFLLFQGHNAALTEYSITQNVTPDTDATLLMQPVKNLRATTAVGADATASAQFALGEAACGFYMYDSADTNEFVGMDYYHTGAGPVVRAFVGNNGVVSTLSGGLAAGKLILYKSTNTYYCYNGTDVEGGGLQYMGTLTKTGVTAFDRLRLYFNTADDTISPILGVDYFRYYASNTFALVNP